MQKFNPEKQIVNASAFDQFAATVYANVSVLCVFRVYIVDVVVVKIKKILLGVFLVEFVTNRVVIIAICGLKCNLLSVKELTRKC